MKSIHGKSAQQFMNRPGWRAPRCRGVTCKASKNKTHLYASMSTFYFPLGCSFREMWGISVLQRCKSAGRSANMKKQEFCIVYVDPDEIRMGFTSHGCNLFMTSSQLFWSPLPNRRLRSHSTGAEMGLFMQRLCPPVSTITPFVGCSMVPDCCFKQQHWHGNPIAAAERFLSRAAAPAL